MSKNKFITAFEKITNSIAEALSDDSKNQKPDHITEVTLDNGNVVKIKGQIQNGNIAFTVGEDSVELPYPNGEYHLEDKSLFRIENGIIVEYVPFEEPQPDKSNNSITDNNDKGVQQKKDENKLHSAHSEDAQKHIDTEQTKAVIEVLQKQIKELNEKFDNQTKVNVELNKQIQTLSDQPSDKPLVATDQVIQYDISKMTVAEKLAYKAKHKK